MSALIAISAFGAVGTFAVPGRADYLAAKLFSAVGQIFKISQKKPAASWRQTMQRPRFTVQEDDIGWWVRDRSGVIEHKRYNNPIDAQYVCDGLNHFHRFKTGRFENAA